MSPDPAQIRRSEVAAGTASDERLHALPITRVGESPPGTRCILQLSDDDLSVHSL